MNFYSLILVACAIGVQCSLSADDETFDNLDNAEQNMQKRAANQAISDLEDSDGIDKRNPRRLTPAVRYAGFGKRQIGSDDNEDYARWVRGRDRRPHGSEHAGYGKRRHDAVKPNGKLRKFGVPSSRLAYFGKREEENSNDSTKENQSEKPTELNDPLLDRLFSVYDLNGDGLISKSEFVIVQTFLMREDD
ncbi:uncharacterized protein LOC144448419 [Glandiceps talaboti]